jgi:predicted polyphosphate/ATP-dependent NAD kinase
MVDKKVLGLIINPVAGIGGAVGLKGSDTEAIQREALRRGAEPQAQRRAAQALEVLLPLKEGLELVTAPGGMGEDLARQLGCVPSVVGKLEGETTSAGDTIKAAIEMAKLPVALLLFAGGDGTARDIYSAVGTNLPILGIPAGVKIHSAVFATHPRNAGEIAAALLRGERIHLGEGEVVDLDEEAYREGRVATRLYGYLSVPSLPHMLQNRKAPSLAADSARLEAIAAAVSEAMEPGWFYVLGPGTTTRAIADRLGFPKTLVGVDVYTCEAAVELDVSEERLLELLKDEPAKIIVTPIGGQGFIFGRGNQQISPKVLRRVGRENIVVVSLVEKLNALLGEPLLVDTGDPDVDAMLAGYWNIIVGYRERVVYRAAS